MVLEIEQKSIWDNRYSKNTDITMNTEWIEKYSKYFNIKKNCTVVDLGCGKGVNSIYLEEQGFDVIACDFSSIAIKFINETYPSIKTKCFDMVKEFPKDISNVGIVLASLSTHYFSFDDTVQLYNNIHSISTLLKGFSIVKINESAAEYHGKEKHFIEVVAQKI